MKKIFTLTFIMLLFLGCKLDLFYSSPMEYVVINNSKNKVDWVKIYAGDFDNSKTLKVSNYNEVLSFGNINPDESTGIKSFNIKNYSQTGQGSIKILALKFDSKDTLKTGGIGFEHYSLSQDFAPSGWRTTQIIISDLPQALTTRLAYYKNGKFVKSYGQ